MLERKDELGWERAVTARTQTRKFLALYDGVAKAVSRCHTASECLQLAAKTEAIEVYNKIDGDKDTIKKLFEIKVRAYRRMAELMLQEIGPLFEEDDGRHNVKIRAMQDKFPSFKRFQIVRALQIHSIPVDQLEVGIRGMTDISSLINKTDPIRTLNLQRQARELTRMAVDVGVTMERVDREPMFDFRFTMKAGVHEALRKAAFDRRITMHAILREALDMWFASNGIPVQVEDEDIAEAVS